MRNPPSKEQLHKRGSPGYNHGHLSSAIIDQLDQQVAGMLADVPVVHDDLEQIGKRSLVV